MLRNTIILALMVLAFSSIAQADAITMRVEEALENGTLSADEAVVILYNSVYNQEAIPSEFIDGTYNVPCATAAFDMIASLSESCSASVLEQLDFVKGRPNPGSPAYTDETEHFVIHWTDAGANATNQSYIDELKIAFELAWTVEIDNLGFDAPPSDQGLGGSEKYDAYVMSLNPGTMGYCSTNGEFPDPNTPEADYSSHIAMSNNVSGFGIENLRETTAHEFQHGVQAGYEAAEPTWFKENCSVWVENEVYDTNGYAQYLHSGENCLRQSWRDIRSGAMYWYGGSPWPMFMEVSTGTTDAVRMVWELCADTVGINMIGAIDGTAQHYGKDFETWLMDYACWRWFTGNNADDEHYEYEESSIWTPGPLVLPWNIVTMNELPITLTDSVYGPESYGMVWVSIDVDEYDGWLNFNFDGRNGWEWGIGVISTKEDGTDSYFTQRITNSEGTIDLGIDAGGWDKVIIAIQNFTVSSLEATYVFDISTITGIEESEAGVTLSVTPVTNPMAGTSAITVSLPTAGFSTLNIYDLSGRLIQNIHAGELPAGDSNISLDSSELEAGTYFARLMAPGGGCSSRFIVVN